MTNCDKCNFNTCDECAFKEKSISEMIDKISFSMEDRIKGETEIGLIKEELIKEINKIIEKIFKEIEEPSYIGVMDSNEKRRGYEIAIKEILLLKDKYLK